MSSQETHRIYINHRPHPVDRARLTGAELAGLAGVPIDNVVVELETPAGLREIGLDTTVPVTAGQSFLITRQFIMGGAA